MPTNKELMFIIYEFGAKLKKNCVVFYRFLVERKIIHMYQRTVFFVQSVQLFNKLSYSYTLIL